MELETVILESNEEMDLGEAQQAYVSYPQLRETFERKLNAYKALLAEFKSKNPATITKKDIEKTDTLHEDVKRSRDKCLDMKAILSHKLETLILEGKGLEGDLAYHARDFDDYAIESGSSLLKEAVELRETGELIDAIEKAYQARECLAELLAQAKDIWIQKHQERVDVLNIEDEV